MSFASRLTKVLETHNRVPPPMVAPPTAESSAVPSFASPNDTVMVSGGRSRPSTSDRSIAMEAAVASPLDSITFTCLECGAKRQSGSHCAACRCLLPLETVCGRCSNPARGRFCCHCGQRLDEEFVSPSRIGGFSTDDIVASSSATQRAVPSAYFAVESEWRRRSSGQSRTSSTPWQQQHQHQQ